MTILTNASQIAAASTSDLVETYNALAGKSIKKFETRTHAERRVEAAIMAAKEADGHTGVPKGTDPQAKPRKQIIAKAKAKGIPVPPALDEEEPVFVLGSMADQLNKAAAATEAIEPRPKKDKATASTTKKESIFSVQATFTGTSKPQAGSTRNNVLLHVQSATNSAATMEALDAHFEQNTRGYIQKLMEKGHLIVLDAAAFAAAKPVKYDKAA